MSLKRLQDVMMGMPQADCPVTHHFSDGIYVRELFIPSGVTLVGAKHLTSHFMMIFKGQCLISGGGVQKAYSAPKLLETKPGTKRAIHAITDTTLMTFHVTDETDVEKIGEEILEPENLLPQWKRIGGAK